MASSATLGGANDQESGIDFHGRMNREVALSPATGRNRGTPRGSATGTTGRYLRMNSSSAIRFNSANRSFGTTPNGIISGKSASLLAKLPFL